MLGWYPEGSRWGVYRIITRLVRPGTSLLDQWHSVSKHLSPQKRYERDLKEQRIFPDTAQAQAVARLEWLYHEVVARQSRKPGIGERFARLLGRARVEPLRGLYFWGGVGRGKTYLMDLFFHCLPGDRKLRMHFHRFMRMVHESLGRLKGNKNPLEGVAREIADKADILCFDEFFVTDIGDAMILGGLLQHLFEEGVCLVATSNIEPERLYERGLQRQKFLPAIALLRHHTHVVNVDGGIDYRLRSLEQAEIYHSPLDEQAELALKTCFQDLATGLETEQGGSMEVLGRLIPFRCWSEGMVWFEFADICGGPRAAADYIEVAQLCHTVLIGNVPVMGEDRDDEARRFITLVDEFYDHGVKLILSAAAPLEDLYTGTALAFAFERTRSRLLEMQSHEYLAREHRP